MILVTFIALILLSIFTTSILRLKQTSTRPQRSFTRPAPAATTEKKKRPLTLAEEELGPSSRHHQAQANPPIYALPEASLPNPLLTTMPNPSIPRPPAPQPTPHTGPATTIALAQGRYTGVLLAGAGGGGGLPQPVEAWRGIPYAQSTGGANRFRPPVPLELAAAEAVVIKKADTFGQVCPGNMRMSAIAEGEDCLNVNVYRPVDWEEQLARNCSSGGSGGSGGSGSKLMPVLVYVHGGAFNTGLGVERDMASFVGWAAEAPILGINFNYRVGALGFPSSVVADAEGCLNLGLRDQRLLFRWVRENVGAFGGDKGRITVMGLSAGAHSIGYHLQSPSSLRDPPFHAAILESGGSTARATLAPNHPRTVTQWNEFLRAANVDPATTPASAIFGRLRDLPLETILAASAAVYWRYQDPVRWPFQPTIETPSADPTTDTGNIITTLPITRFRHNAFLRIPILTGFNTNEGSYFCNPAIPTQDAFLAKFTTMIPALAPRDTAALADLYPDPTTTGSGSGSDSTSPSPSQRYAHVPPGFGAHWARYEAAYAHYAYICPVLQTAHFYSEAFHRHYYLNNAAHAQEEAQPPVWVYHFAARSQPRLGGLANHGDEAAVVTHSIDSNTCPGLARTSAAMHGAWARFVVSGDPNLPPPSTTNASSSVFWPRFSSPFIGDTVAAPGQLRRKPDSDNAWGRVMLFGEGNDERCGDDGTRSPGTPARVVPLSEHEVAQCRFWWERVELSEGMGQRLVSGAEERAKARL